VNLSYTSNKTRENAVFRYKTIIGRSMQSRTFGALRRPHFASIPDGLATRSWPHRPATSSLPRGSSPPPGVQLSPPTNEQPSSGADSPRFSDSALAAFGCLGGQTTRDVL